MNAAEPKHAKLTEHRFTTEATGAARGHLVTPNQEPPHALVHVVVHRPVSQQARPITEVRAPAAQQAVQLGTHERPWRLIARDEDLTNLALEPLDALRRRARPHVPVAILPEAVRAERVTQEVVHGSWRGDHHPRRP